VLKGTLACRSCEIAAVGSAASVESAGRMVENQVDRRADRLVVTLSETLRLAANNEMRIMVHA